MLFSDHDEEMNMEERQAKLQASPLYQKAREILEIVMALNKAMPSEHAEHFSQSLIESALLIPAKIAGAFHSDSWVICMENASLVRHHAAFLLSSTFSLDSIFDVKGEYVDVLRQAMLEFRELFIEWADQIHRLEKNDWDEDEWVLYRR